MLESNWKTLKGGLRDSRALVSKKEVDMRASKQVAYQSQRENSKRQQFTPSGDLSFESEHRSRREHTNNQSPEDLKRKLGIEIGPKREMRNLDTKMPVIKEKKAYAEESNHKDRSIDHVSLNSIPENRSIVVNQFNISPKLIKQHSNEASIQEDVKSSQLSLIKAKSDNQRMMKNSSKLFEADKYKSMKSELSIVENIEDDKEILPVEKAPETKKTMNSVASLKNFTKKNNLDQETVKKTTASKGFERDLAKKDKIVDSPSISESRATDRTEPKSTRTITQEDSKPKPTANRGDIDITLKNDVEIVECVEEKMQSIIKLLEQIEKVKKIDLKPQKELFNKQLKVVIKKINT